MKPSAEITVLIADRQKKSRTACLALLQAEKGIRVMEEVRSGMETLSAIARLKPKVLLLNFNLLKGGKIALISSLGKKSPAPG